MSNQTTSDQCLGNGVPWNHYRTTHVRNLAWCLLSPSLLTSPYAGHKVWQVNTKTELIDWLETLDKNPEPLLQHMTHCKSPRLGFLYEHYWHFYWEAFIGQAHVSNGTSTGTWINNLQVNSEGTFSKKTTLGEADFVQAFPSEKKLLHKELAVKFYLGFETPNKKWLWLGPNCIDRLDLKLDQLANKQLRLFEHPEARLNLPNAWQGFEVETEITLSGQLYYPAHQRESAKSRQYLNPEHLNGRWYYLNDFLAISRSSENSTCVLLEKSEWFCSPAAIEKSRLLNQENTGIILKQQLSNPTPPTQLEHRKVDMTPRPLMLSLGKVLNENNNGNFDWQESERVFVVPDDWPRL